jgi:hypothetical protein
VLDFFWSGLVRLHLGVWQERSGLTLCKVYPVDVEGLL